MTRDASISTMLLFHIQRQIFGVVGVIGNFICAKNYLKSLCFSMRMPFTHVLLLYLLLLHRQNIVTVTAEDVKKSENVGSLSIIWSGKKNRQQRELDDAATVDFIALVKKNWSALNDKYTTKK